MREIKFRAWDKKNKKWFNLETMDFINKLVNDFSGSDVIQLSFKDVVLVQFTGLKDKNGKEIYEGDIIEFNTSEPKEHRWIEKIEFGNKWCEEDSYGDNIHICGFYSLSTDIPFEERKNKNCRKTRYTKFHSGLLDDTKIIGNIYENPDLLTKNQHNIRLNKSKKT